MAISSDAASVFYTGSLIGSLHERDYLYIIGVYNFLKGIVLYELFSVKLLEKWFPLQGERAHSL